MRTVLLVSYHFLPVHNVGVKQFASYCRYLPEYGWQAAVLSNDWSGGIPERDAGWGLSYVPGLMAEAGERTRVYPAPFRPYRNALLDVHEAVKRRTDAGSATLPRAALLPVRRALSTGWRFFGEYPDRFVGWIDPAVARGAELIGELGVDAIVSNCPPQTNHVVAGRLARRFGLPWVPYFGDLFGFYVGPGDWHQRPLKRALALRQNRHWLRGASSALAVSPRMTALLDELYDLPGEVVVVGYDEADFPAGAPPRGDRLRLSHVGSIYPGDQRPELFFDALDALLARHPEAAEAVEALFVGSKCEEWLEGLVAGRPCAAVTKILPKVPPAEAIAIQRESDVLLLFNLTAPHTAGGTLSYPSKVFEYFAARRPILALPGDGDWVDTLLRRTAAGIAVGSAEEGARVLEDWYLAWRATGAVPFAGRGDEIAAFSQRKQAQLLARALDEAAVGQR